MTYVVSRMWDQIKDARPLLRRASLRWFNGAFLKAMFDTYHPEQYYMRGSGPKSRSMNCKQGPPSKQT
jgi:hypothetical protein